MHNALEVFDSLTTSDQHVEHLKILLLNGKVVLAYHNQTTNERFNYSIDFLDFLQLSIDIKEKLEHQGLIES